MEIEFLITADSVEAVSGKLYMLGGGWDRWTSQSYPAAIRMGIAIGVLVPWDQTNEKHRLTVLVKDADGQQVVPPIGAEVEVGRAPGLTPGTTQRAILAINAGFPLPKPGRYEISVTAPDGSEKRVAFDAALAGRGTLQVQ
jgi:hypothetical protein